MGLASSIGLGLAMGRPDLRVFVLDGDGSLLMNLGSLATIAARRPSNLVLIVWDNEEYGTTGGQPTPTAGGADLAGAARALGVAHSAVVRTDREFSDAIAQASREGGASVIVAKVVRIAADREAPARLCVHQAAIHVCDRRSGAGHERRCGVTVDLLRATKRLADFAATAAPPATARARAATAVLDTIGVSLAGANEPAARIVRATIAADGAGASAVIGARDGASAPNAALANGTSAHALDYDDMCFVSLAHPSAPLVAGTLAAAELVGANGQAVLDAYVVGFEIEARLGVAMNPRHYERGWHCTSTLGTVGTAAAAGRVLGLDSSRMAHAVAIAASAASGLKENFGTMVKPLHAGLAARSGLLAALLAKQGMTASEAAIDGPQGFLAAMDSRLPSIDGQVGDLGSRWEIVDTGITVKLYPSCAGTHPPLDALLALRRREGVAADAVDRIEVFVDSITPTVLDLQPPDIWSRSEVQHAVLCRRSDRRRPCRDRDVRGGKADCARDRVVDAADHHARRSATRGNRRTVDASTGSHPLEGWPSARGNGERGARVS